MLKNQVSFGVLSSLLLFVFCSASAAAQGGGEQELDRAGERLFRNYTRVFCQQFFKYEDRFILLPNYYRDREASTGMTYDQAVEELTEVELVRAGPNVVREIKHLPPRGEAVAASMVLPAIDVGHYGYIDAVTVVRVVRDNEMVVKNLRLIDPAALGTENNALRKALAERQKQYIDVTYRLHGFSTEGLSPGQVYRGPRDEGLHVAVAGADQHHNFVLVNFDRMDRIRTREFSDALGYVHITPAAFNELVRSNREQHGVQGDKATMIDIYKRYYTAFRVPRPAAPANNPRVPDTPPAERDPGPGNEPGNDPGPADPDPPPGNVPGNTPADPPPPPVDDAWDDDQDDWDDDWTPPAAPDDPNFFGIPLD